MLGLGVEMAERGFAPDAVLRMAIRQLIGQRARSAAKALADGSQAAFVRTCARGPIAVATADANDQHYEVPAAFFEQVLGAHLKYSCAAYDTGLESLDQAEAAMLQRSCERAQISDGMRILELGCGWGSLSLWMARHYPNATITAVSNSHSQRQYIEAQARAAGLQNLNIHTADINQFRPEGRFDRIVSVEMFEHLRNHQRLFARMRTWLEDDGRIFVHVFCHEHYAYPYESKGPGDWMAEHFFTGGMMPSFALLPEAAAPAFHLEESWKVSGNHYAQTCDAWLANLDKRRSAIETLFTQTYGPDHAQRWIQRWRIFFMACAELFRYQSGASWYVAHYRFTPKSP